MIKGRNEKHRAGLFECVVCDRRWVDALPPLWDPYWPSCCLMLAHLVHVYEQVAGCMAVPGVGA